MAYSTLRYEVSDGIATVALDQPDTRNALSDELLAELIDAFETARDDDAVRCVVLTSTHEKVFSSGANLAGFASEAPLVHKHIGTERFPRLFRLIGELGKPVICAANGHVLAGALGIALVCDLIIAREGARFGTPEINVGACPARRPQSCCCWASRSRPRKPSGSGSSIAWCRLPSSTRPCASGPRS